MSTSDAVDDCILSSMLRESLRLGVIMGLWGVYITREGILHDHI